MRKLYVLALVAILLVAGAAGAQIQEWQLSIGGFGDWRWQDPVADVDALPEVGATGACHLVLEPPDDAPPVAYCWDGAAWQATGTGGSSADDQTAAEVPITDEGDYYLASDVETALQEIGDGTTLDGRYLRAGDNGPLDLDIGATDYAGGRGELRAHAAGGRAFSALVGVGDSSTASPTAAVTVTGDQSGDPSAVEVSGGALRVTADVFTYNGAELLDEATADGRYAALDHATRHQHGGADEVATSTPGANAIPKAGAGGTLAAGWVPTLNQNTTGNAATATTASGLVCSGCVDSTDLGFTGLSISGGALTGATVGNNGTITGGNSGSQQTLNLVPNAGAGTQVVNIGSASASNIQVNFLTNGTSGINIRGLGGGSATYEGFGVFQGSTEVAMVKAYPDGSARYGRGAAEDDIVVGASGGVTINEPTTINYLLKLVPQVSAPASCVAATDIYTDTSGALCFCTATNTWTNVSGVGSCA